MSSRPDEELEFISVSNDDDNDMMTTSMGGHPSADSGRSVYDNVVGSWIFKQSKVSFLNYLFSFLYNYFIVNPSTLLYSFLSLFLLLIEPHCCFLSHYFQGPGYLPIHVWLLVHFQFHFHICLGNHIISLRLLDCKERLWPPTGGPAVVVLCQGGRQQ